MTITEMLGQSGLLTLLGMGVVFGFIIILICCMNLLKIFVHAFKFDKEESKDTPVASAPVSSAGNDGSIVAVIAAAVHDKALNS